MHIDIIAIATVEDEPGEAAIHGLEIGIIVKFFGELINGESDSAAPNVEHFFAEHLVVIGIVLDYPCALRLPFVSVNSTTLKIVLKQNLGRHGACTEN